MFRLAALIAVVGALHLSTGCVGKGTSAKILSPTDNEISFALVRALLADGCHVTDFRDLPVRRLSVNDDQEHRVNDIARLFFMECGKGNFEAMLLEP